MINTLYLPELREMLAENDTAGLQEFCTALHPARTAEFMEGLNAVEAWSVLAHTDLNNREQIFAYFPHERKIEFLDCKYLTDSRITCQKRRRLGPHQYINVFR